MMKAIGRLLLLALKVLIIATIIWLAKRILMGLVGLFRKGRR